MITPKWTGPSVSATDSKEFFPKRRPKYPLIRKTGKWFGSRLETSKKERRIRLGQRWPGRKKAGI